MGGFEFDQSSSPMAAALLWHSQHSGYSSTSGSDHADAHEMSHHSKVTTILLSIVYGIGFIVMLWGIKRKVYDSKTKTATWDQPWVPAATRRDAAAMLFFPVFLLLPAILWPLVMACWILMLMVSGLSLTLGTADSCFGIPLPHKKQAEADGEDSAMTRDLELGAVAGDRSIPEGGEEVDTDRASVGSAASAKSERPPSYTSAAPDEENEGETDGLLDKGGN